MIDSPDCAIPAPPTMTPVASDKPATASSPAAASPASPVPTQHDRFLRLLFFLARRAPGLLRVVRPLAVAGTPIFAREVRDAVRANARRLLPPPVSLRRQDAFVHAVVGQFFDFVAEMGICAELPVEALRDRIDDIVGHDAFMATRRQHRGAIILTAHLGSFELGLAALRTIEPVIHVVFKRDAMDGFEGLRRNFRQRLGIHEAPIDAGWETWLRLREVLANDGVVVMQADRAMAGQKSLATPVLGGHLRLPVGPAKLAQLCQSPLFPVFVLRTKLGRCRLFVEPAIHTVGDEGPATVGRVDAIEPALAKVGQSLEKFLAAYPEQWLRFDRAFVEDQSG